ncbi:MAG: ShlB/FhaC/HecB family hemolysin secretion/activation protein [Burkholderiales bacterium]|nr:ShlB/FhaC/HecB family hemolysin secretion/activation protein [Burkholderiales bacterium]
MRILVWLSLALPLMAAAAPRPIERLQIEGNRALPTALLEAVAAPWLGRELDEAQIELLRQALTRAYVERGYLNSGVLLQPEQNLSGALRVRVVEGRLVGMELRGLGGLSERYVRARLDPQPGEVLNMDRLRERFQLLLADPLVKRANARLLPAEQLGEAVLDVELERARPWQASATLNNHRPVSVGEWQVGVRASLSNLSGHGDTVDLNLQQALEKGDQRQASLHGRLPWPGAPATQLQLGLEHSDAAVVEEPVARLDIESRVRGFELGVAHALHETPRERIAVGLQHQWRRQRSTLLGEPFSFVPNLPDGRELKAGLWRFWQEASWRSETQVLALRSSLNGGRSNVLAEAAMVGVEAAPAPRTLFWTGQAQWVRKLGENLQGTVRGTVQVARDRLLAHDGLAAGGVRSVRGQRENALVRDEGGLLSLELEWTLHPEGWDDARFTLTPFVDAARLRNRGQPWASLSSLGLGLAAHWRGWSLELVAAKRLQDGPPVAEDVSLQDQGVHLQISHRW